MSELTASVGARCSSRKGVGGGETESEGGVKKHGNSGTWRTNEGNSFALLHLKVTVLEERPVLVAVCESLHREHILSHSLHSREPTARQQLYHTSVKSQSLPIQYCMVGSKAGLACLMHSLVSEAI